MKKQTRRISLRRLKKWINGERAGPVKVDIEPTACCNLKCKFCWQRDEERVEWCDYGRTLSSERLVDIVREAADMGVREWQVAGGWEPTADIGKTYPMLKEIKKNDMYGCITTNGVGFEEKHIRKLVEMGWDQMLLSVEGPDAEIHDGLTQVEGSFKRVEKNVRLFQKFKRELGKEKPKYSVHAVLNSENYDKLAEMVEMADDWGCEGVNFEPMLPWSDEAEDIKLSEKQRELLDYYIDKGLEAANRLEVHTNLGDIKGEDDLVDKDVDSKEVLERSVKEKEENIVNSPCYVPWLSLEIRVSGRVVPCRLCDNDAGAPEIHDRSLDKIWYGDYFNRMRKNMVKRNLPDYCSTCASGDIVDQEKLRKRLKEGKVKRKLHDVID